MNQNNTNNRSWNDLKVAQRLSVSLNPLRNWAEAIIPQNEKKFKELSEQGQTRPAKALTFLMGDPTRYQSFQTTEQTKLHVIQAVGQVNGYTNFLGDLKIRAQLAEKLSTDKWKLTQDDVILTMAGSLALYYCIYSMCDKDDIILLPQPSFPLMDAFAKFLGVQTIRYHLNPTQGWQPDVQEIDQLLTNNKNVRFILINSPSNPLGNLINEQIMIQLIQVCEKHNNLPIVSDEIYEDMVFPDQQFKFLSEYPGTVPILRCSGLTKKCLVPGWRMGWLAFFGKPGVFDQIKKGIQGLANIILMPNTIVQTALLPVYSQSLQHVPTTMQNLQQRFKVFNQKLSNISGIVVGETNGAMYSTLIMDPTKFKDIANSKEFAIKLQIEENVLAFPGELFSGVNFMRFVICSDIEVLEEACDRIKHFCLRHQVN